LLTQRLLLEADWPLRLGSRAMDILIALLEHPGELKTKDELMARVWPDTEVVEDNLTVHVAALRRAIRDAQDGNRYVVNIPGRGYRFVAPVTIVQRKPAGGGPRHNIPASLTRLIGRESTVDQLADLLGRERLLTITGAGGVGKTGVALALGERLLSRFEQGTWLVDLGSIDDPALVPRAVASALGLKSRDDSGADEVIGALRDKQVLLILDTCEHVIDAVASLALAILRAAPAVQILATGRRPLRLEGEQLLRLAPLELPPISQALTAEETMRFPAVRMFVASAQASLVGYELTDTDAPDVAQICRRVDGLPLGIGLAAARLDLFGIHGLAAHLEDGFDILAAGWRTAPARHQSLRASVEWSYGLLTECERGALRRLAGLADPFEWEQGLACLASTIIPPLRRNDIVANLVANSLVVADVGGPVARYRLLETTRGYLSRLPQDAGKSKIAG
jgi:predicted ATPase/DNA-binding winged helix-turn-helix (wHTH) protein